MRVDPRGEGGSHEVQHCPSASPPAELVAGAAHGPLFPASVAYLSRWLPSGERAWASNMLDSGISVGSLVTM